MPWWPKSVSDYKWPRGTASRRWLAAGTFHLCHLAGRVVNLLRPNESAVLVIRTDGIGDAVLAEPMMASLGRRFADCSMHVWAPQATCELLRAAPYIHHRMTLPRGYKEGNLHLLQSPKLRAKLGYALGRFRFAAVIYLARSPEPLGNWLLVSARADQRWYSPGNTENQFAAQQAKTSAAATRLFVAAGGHDLSRNARLAGQWSEWIETCAPAVHLDEKAARTAEAQNQTWRRMAGEWGASAVLGLMPAASMASKMYPNSAWVKAAAKLWHQHRIVTALLGGPADSATLYELSQQLGRLPHLRLFQALDLPAMAGLIGRLDGLLSVDTGLAHLALAQDVPTVTLVGGGQPGRFFPWALPRNSVTLNHRMPCEGCSCRCHLATPECLTRIEPGEIVAAVAMLLKPKIRLPMRAAG
jgi:ADP-heptose:LPS heptosyltransferase